MQLVSFARVWSAGVPGCICIVLNIEVRRRYRPEHVGRPGFAVLHLVQPTWTRRQGEHQAWCFSSQA
jgi:hypothetical protein